MAWALWRRERARRGIHGMLRVGEELCYGLSLFGVVCCDLTAPLGALNRSVSYARFMTISVGACGSGPLSPSLCLLRIFG